MFYLADGSRHDCGGAKKTEFDFDDVHEICVVVSVGFGGTVGMFFLISGEISFLVKQDDHGNLRTENFVLLPKCRLSVAI